MPSWNCMDYCKLNRVTFNSWGACCIDLWKKFLKISVLKILQIVKQLIVFAKSWEILVIGFFSIFKRKQLFQMVFLKYLPNKSKSTFTWETKWTHTGLRFQTDVKTSSAHIKFHFSCISKRPNILMNMRRYFISGSVYVIITRNEISFLSKWPIWSPYLHWVSNAHAH